MFVVRTFETPLEMHVGHPATINLGIVAMNQDHPTCAIELSTAFILENRIELVNRLLDNVSLCAATMRFDNLEEMSTARSTRHRGGMNLLMAQERTRVPV